MAPKLAAHQDAIFLNPKLFARVKALYDQRDSARPRSGAKYLLERYHRDFRPRRRAAVEADKTTLRALNKEESKLTTAVRDKVLADTNARAVVVDDKAELDGLSDGDIGPRPPRPRRSASSTGKWVLALQNTTQQPALASLAEPRAARAAASSASMHARQHGGANDTKAIVARLAQLRAQKAKLLGFPTTPRSSSTIRWRKTPGERRSS